MRCDRRGAVILCALVPASCADREHPEDMKVPAAVDTSTESWTVSGKDASWDATIRSSGIVFRRLAATATDSIVFAYRAPRTDGIVRTFTSVRMATDTHRIDITLAATACADRNGGTYSHTARVSLDRVDHVGCARWGGARTDPPVSRTGR